MEELPCHAPMGPKKEAWRPKQESTLDRMDKGPENNVDESEDGARLLCPSLVTTHSYHVEAYEFVSISRIGVVLLASGFAIFSEKFYSKRII